MSRSNRKAYWTEGYGGKWRKFAKRQANKAVRRCKQSLDNGGWFKLLYNSWDIVDCKLYDPDSDKIKRK